ncbi:MAG: MFS transporter [Bosea sp. (in: a-proteobacteria)]|nr:MAG: MFS transporter [Bosea sp. (in: a-proteobacteria)]
MNSEGAITASNGNGKPVEADQVSVAARPSNDVWRTALVFGGLYAAQGIGASMAQFVVPTLLRQQGIGLALIGLSYLLFLPVVLKPLMGPATDRYVAGSVLRRRKAILRAQCALVACFAFAALLRPGAGTMPWLAALLFVVMTAIAAQDLSTDALAVEAIPPTRRGIANGAQVAGVYLGYVFAIALWFQIYGAMGWAVALLALASSFVAIGIIGWVGSATFQSQQAWSSPASSEVRLASAFRHRPFVNGLVFLAIYQLGGRIGAAIIGPFLIDAAFPLATIGWVTGIGMGAAGLAGAFCGPVMLGRLGTTRMLVFTGLAHALCFAGLAVAAQFLPAASAATTVLVLLESTVFALSYVALFTLMMSRVQPHQAGTDFALLQSADSLVAILAGAGASWFAGQVGYRGAFLAGAALLTVACLGATRLLASRPFCLPKLESSGRLTAQDRLP